MTVQTLIDQVLAAAMRLGQKPHGAYRSYWDIYNPIITFFRNKGLEEYSPEIIQEYIAWVTEKYQNGNIKRERHSRLTTAARRVAHFESTGTYKKVFSLASARRNYGHPANKSGNYPKVSS